MFRASLNDVCYSQAAPPVLAPAPEQEAAADVCQPKRAILQDIINSPRPTAVPAPQIPPKVCTFYTSSIKINLKALNKSVGQILLCCMHETSRL